MRDWIRAQISDNASIRDAVEAVQESNCQIALIVDSNKILLGTVTDGDIRRGLLQGYSMDKLAITIANRRPITAPIGTQNSELLATLKKHVLHQLPLIEPSGSLAGFAHIDELQNKDLNPQNYVVLMAGGLGTRLRPLTQDVPKPLLNIGNKPLLETILESFAQQGFQRFFISVNYLADSIIDHFGDGSRWGISIEYLREEKPLGTAGALRLLPTTPAQPLIVMNGDLLTRINFKDLLTYHIDNKATGTMCVREYDMEVPFGVIEIVGNKIQRIDEKPVHRFFVNAGVYVISPDALSHIPREGRFDMPGLFDAIKAEAEGAIAFPIHEYWLDVGRIDDFERAKIDIMNGFLK